MKIACDVQVSHRTIKYLRSQGFDIVVIANPSESDIDWFRRGLALDAVVFVSNDLDLATLVEKEHDRRLFWVRFPSLPYSKANEWLLNRLNKTKEVWGL